MSDQVDNFEENVESDENISSSGKKSGSGEAGGIILPAKVFQAVATAFRHLDGEEVVARLAEFFSELPARASATIEVSWNVLSDKANKGFAVISNFLDVGNDIIGVMRDPSRRTMDKFRSKYRLSPKARIIPGVSG
jgi:hypothetical protein